MRRIITLLTVCLGLSACAILPSNPFARATPQTDLPYRASLLTERRGLPDFGVTVDARGAPLAAFRESARFQGTRYCLQYFGSSEIDWQRDGADWAVRYAPNGRARVAGRCIGR